MTDTQREPSDEFHERWHRILGDSESDMAITLGLEPIDGGPESVELRMKWTPQISQPGGLFSAPALFGLADISGTTLATYHVPEGLFPLAVQLSMSLLTNAKGGSARSRSTLVRAGRSLVVTSTEIFDDNDRRLSKVEATYFVGSAPAPGR